MHGYLGEFLSSKDLKHLFGFNIYQSRVEKSLIKINRNLNQMSNNKVKGLLKGLRYISQIFDNEKEPEMQIGLPTDVKHVAHIGWDGPSVNSAPSWMNEFKAPAGEVDASNSPARDLPDLPRASRRSSTGASAESPTRERADKPKSSRRGSKNSSAKELSGSDSCKPSRIPLDSSLGSESPSRNLPDIPKKTRRKKSKDSSVGGSTRSSRLKGQATETYSDLGSESGSVSRLNNGEHRQSSNLKPFEEGEEKGVIGIA